MIEPERYCRDLEAYLCRKNDGHLIRIAGPAFEQVAGWARDGIPFGVACAGIDRYFERYYRKGQRRRPVRIEFCDADVRDAYDDWRRAVGVAKSGLEGTATGAASTEEPSTRRRGSLATHVERTIARLTALRASSREASVREDRALDEALARSVAALDALQAEARTARGQARDTLVERLASLDRVLIDAALAALDDAAREEAAREARETLAPFRSRMDPDAYLRACAAATERSVRDRLGLPTIAFAA
jgi:hypothetical protein